MHKITKTYIDFDGNERKEDFYFNLTKAELTDMDLEISGGMTGMLQRIIDANDVSALAREFKAFIHKSYGIKTPDGRSFIKTKEALDSFVSTQAYSDIYMKLVEDDEYAINFIKAVIPSDLREAIEKKEAEEDNEKNND